jgi:histone-lysine N-methyltransferase SETMAR
MDNATPHNGAKVASIMGRQLLVRAQYPPYSPDIGPCHFWLLGAVKHTMKDIELSLRGQIVRMMAKFWDDLTFEDVQLVFEEWITSLEWAIANGGEYCIK